MNKYQDPKYMYEQGRAEEMSIEAIEQLIKDMNLDIDVDTFINTYASNRGIKANAINVWRNIYKWELYVKGNKKHLLNVLGDELNFLNPNPKYYQYGNSQYRASQKYKKENIKRVVVSLNKNTDEEIIEHLDTIDNVQGYIKSLIRKDIEDGIR